VTPKVISSAQVALSWLYTTGYFAVLAAFILGYAKPPPDWKDAVTALLGALTAGQLMVLQFWFSRSREKE
jgi:Zn-dependent protease with chaperone function